MNFSEYVAILSGNTELLEKARLEKKITTLESERQAFIRGKSSSRYKLEEITKKVEKERRPYYTHRQRPGTFQEPGAASMKTVRTKTRFMLDGVQGGDMKFIGKHLNHIAETYRTHDEFKKIGSLYGFDIVVKSETYKKEELDLTVNRFYVRGEGDYLYHYNHGNLAADPRLASQNFINALGTIRTVT